MIAFATAERVITSPRDMDRVCSPSGLSPGAPGLSSEQESFLCDHDSTELEDLWIGH